MVISDTEAVYLYGLDIIAQQQSERLYYMHDGLGSVRQLPDSVGGIKTNYAYAPFGVPAVLLLLLIGPQVLVGCQTTEHFFDVTGDLVILSAAQHYDEAVIRATEWRGDAYLFVVTADVASSSGSPPTGGDITYYFQSPTTHRSFLSVRLTDDDWVTEVIARTATERPPEIAREDWVLDSVDAWNIGLGNGGWEFLTDHQDPSTSLEATLTYFTVGYARRLVWRVNFHIPAGPSLGLKIHPVTGEILEVKTR